MRRASGSTRSPASVPRWPQIGLVPKQSLSEGKDKLGSISIQGDRYLRSLFTAGALAVIRHAKIHGTKHPPWLTALLTRRPTKVAAEAVGPHWRSGQRFVRPSLYRPLNKACGAFNGPLSLSGLHHYYVRI
jgi:transposase